MTYREASVVQGEMCLLQNDGGPSGFSSKPQTRGYPTSLKPDTPIFHDGLRGEDVRTAKLRKWACDPEVILSKPQGPPDPSELTLRTLHMPKPAPWVWGRRRVHFAFYQ